jgi:CRP/FNR family transcriptional regulator
MDIVDFVKQFPRREFKKGELVMSEGDISETLLAIVSGFISVTSVDDAGDERLLWIAGRYDIAPTERLFSRHSPLQFFYTALSDGIAYQINKADFLNYAKTDLTMMTEVAMNMSSHYDDLLARINTVEQTSIRGKLIATLHYLAQRFSADDTVDLYLLGLRLTHQDIAKMIGSTRETTSLELQRLQRDGYISYDRTRFIVHVSKCKL